MMNSADRLHDSVSEYYGKVVQNSSDLKTDVCVIGDLIKKHHKEILSKISPIVLERFYGCGSPIPDPLEGCTILDLGSGTGRDCFLASVLAGKSGRVIGIDMTDEQLKIANGAIAYHKDHFKDSSPVEFRKGYIEDLKSVGIQDSSIDVVISNCVVNLASDKMKVFKEIFRVLKDGGEVHISDIFSDRELPQLAKEDKVLVGECLGNAIDISKFNEIMNEIGFSEVKVVDTHIVHPPNDIPEEVIPKEVVFLSITFRAFKGISKRNNKNEVVTYKGGIPGSESQYSFSVENIFNIGSPVPVHSDIAEIIKKSRLNKYFEVLISKEEQVPSKQLTFFEALFKAESTSPAKSCCCSGKKCC